MRVEELEDALRLMVADQPDVTDGRPAVQRRMRRRRIRIASVAVASAVIVVVLAVAWWPESDESTSLRVVDEPQPVATVPAAVVECFPQLQPSTGASTAAIPMIDLSSDLAPLLALTDAGDLWVIEDGLATSWTTTGDGVGSPGYLWARWAGDGSILASRLVDGAVRIERLTGPGEASVAVDLPYTISDTAPEGYCPIDGYLASFSAGPDDVILVHHDPGPIGHSCPEMPPEASTATTDPWRCQSPEQISFETRPDVEAEGGGMGLFIGGSAPLPIVSDGVDTAAFVTKTDPSATVVTPGGSPECCFGGQEGEAFALSPDGETLAFSPDGRTVRVAGIERASDEGTEIWTAPDLIEAMAWTPGWIAVAHAGGLTLVSPEGAAVDLPRLGSDRIVVLDWGMSAVPPPEDDQRDWVTVSATVLHAEESVEGPIDLWAWVTSTSDPPEFEPRWELLYQRVPVVAVDPRPPLEDGVSVSFMTFRVPPDAAELIATAESVGSLAVSPSPPGGPFACESPPRDEPCRGEPEFTP